MKVVYKYPLKASNGFWETDVPKSAEFRTIAVIDGQPVAYFECDAGAENEQTKLFRYMSVWTGHVFDERPFYQYESTQVVNGLVIHYYIKKSPVVKPL